MSDFSDKNEHFYIQLLVAMNRYDAIILFVRDFVKLAKPFHYIREFRGQKSTVKEK